LVLRAGCAWRFDDGESAPVALDARVVPLLHGIADLRSLAAASREAGVPYRSAWAALEEASRLIGAPLAELTRGRGAVLTPLGKRLLAADDDGTRLLETRLAPIDVDPRAPLPRPGRALRVAASHDIALAQLRDRWRLAHAIDLQFHGSAESLDAYRAGNVDVAGFHVVRGATRVNDPLLRRLDGQRDVLIRFLTREQGLIVPRGNPRRLRGVRDLGRGGLRIVNRQPGSGTRLLFDRLLERAAVQARGLAGYDNEEFTHAAVAATVAAGRADAAFGIRAAAAQFGLGFVRVATERYLFACRRSVLERPSLEAFRKLLGAPATRAVIAPLPGYALDRPGELASGKP
jgi:molybdate transport repressor ModE-like protein